MSNIFAGKFEITINYEKTECIVPGDGLQLGSSYWLVHFLKR